MLGAIIKAADAHGDKEFLVLDSPVAGGVTHYLCVEKIVDENLGYRPLGKAIRIPVGDVTEVTGEPIALVIQSTSLAMIAEQGKINVGATSKPHAEA